MSDIENYMQSLHDFAQKRLKFDRHPRWVLDQTEGEGVFGKTAFYNPSEEVVTIYTSNRHPKDILRSFAHELVHHAQNLRGELTPEKCGNLGAGYAQSNKHMRNMEAEAYLKGNLCFRDWEDGCKKKVMY